MNEQRLLLSLLQFVALIAPAIAILMQVIVALHDEGNSEQSLYEVRLIQWSLILVLLGGIIIGVELFNFITNTIVKIGIILIFGSLPFLAISIWLANTRYLWRKESDLNFIEHIFNRIISIGSISVSTIFSGFVLFISFSLTQGIMINYLNYGYFYENNLIRIFFIIQFIVILILVILTLWGNNALPSTNLKKVVNNTFICFFTIYSFYLLFVVPVYIIVFLIVFIFEINKSNLFLNIPHIWSILIILILYLLPIDLSEHID